MKSSKLKVKTLWFKKLWIGIGILVLLSPLGLIIPDLLKAGGAWGEWGTNEIEKVAGYVPHGLKKLSELWSALIPDYAFSGWDRGIKSYIAYIISGLIGVAIIVGVTYLFAKILKRGERGMN